MLCCRLQDELERLEQQERQRTQQADAAIQAARAEKEGSGMGAAAAAAAAGGAKLTTEMALAVINMRNRDKNVLKVRNESCLCQSAHMANHIHSIRVVKSVGPRSGRKKGASRSWMKTAGLHSCLTCIALPASSSCLCPQIFQGVGPSSGIKKEGKEGNDVFSRRHTQSKVYWQTSKEKQEAAKAAAAEGGMQRQGSVDVTLLQGKQKTMAPSELIKVRCCIMTVIGMANV